MPALDRGVAYWRMSSSPQEKSIPQQRAEMLPRCQLEGVEIVREFRDEAKSGGSMKKRDEFQAMLLFCQEQRAAGQPIQAIVCYDTSRFSRADSNETAAYIWEFRRAGVNRLLTRERWFDFRKEDDRTIFNLQQDFTNNRYLRDHSARVLRGKLDNARAGFHNGGTTPYGFDRLLVNGKGEVIERIPRGSRVRLLVRAGKDGKRDFHEVLAPIPADDPEPARQQERQTAVWMFETFLAEDIAPRGLAKRLNDQGIPAPQAAYGKTDAAWTAPTIEWILQNPAYSGQQRWGRDAGGAYNRVIGGKAEPCPEPETRRTRNDKGLTLNPIPAGGLVAPALQAAVLAKLRQRRREGWPTHSRGYALSGGLLRCGRCGARMHGTVRSTTYKGQRRQYRMYMCDSHKKRPGTCRAYAIAEDKVLPTLLRLLHEHYLAPGRLAALERKVIERARSRRRGEPARLAALRAKVAGLDEDVRRAVQNVMRCRDNVDLLNEELTRLRRERDAAAAELDALERAQAVPDAEVAERARKAVARLTKLRETLAKAPPDKLAPVLKLLVASVQLYFEDPPRPRQRFRFVKGVIHTRPIPELQETRGEAPGESLEFVGSEKDE